jgi:hypothetical protein
LKHAQCEGLEFEENRLCHKFTGKALDTERDTKVEHYEVYLDAFTDEPVNLFAQGYCHCKHGKGHHHGSEKETEKIDFTLQVSVKEFEVPSLSEEKEWFSMPASVKKVCQHSGEDFMNEEDLDPHFRVIMEALL